MQVEPIVREVAERFGLSLHAWERIVRSEGDPVLVLRLDDRSGASWFLKEVQHHSRRQGMDSLFAQLATVSVQRSRLLLPVAHGSGRFVLSWEERSFLLFPWVDLTTPIDGHVPHDALIEAVKELHESMADLALPSMPGRTYEGWLRVGVDGVASRLGDTAPLVRPFRAFLDDRLAHIVGPEVNIHGDVHRHNLAVDPQGKLVILDFDLARPGPAVQDFVGATGIYTTLHEGRIRLEEPRLEKLLGQLQSSSTKIEARDARMLLCRTWIGPLRGPGFPEDEARRLLLSLWRFVGE